MNKHHYMQRIASQPVAERFCGDPVVSFLYSRVREQSGWLYKVLTSAWLTDLLGTLRFDLRPADPARMRLRYARAFGLDWSECVAPIETLDTPRKLFERQIRYWECRPMEPDVGAVVAPADGRLLVGSLKRNSCLFLKDKFFEFDELLAQDKPEWRKIFENGLYAIVRLTPDKYHYTHVPASGLVLDFYEIEGRFQSCHPAVVVAHGTPHSKNRRSVTILDTDVPGGSQVGRIAMIEIVALMIGQVVQCYSHPRYEDPQPVRTGMWLERGAAKSLFRPGSSTVVLFFEPGRVQFCEDIVAACRRDDVQTWYRDAWGVPLVELDVRVRSTIARKAKGVGP